MERKKLISIIYRAHTTPEQQAAIDHHIEQGYRITNMKETLLHSVVSFTSLEEGSYAVDKALKEKIGNRAKILFGYAISSGNECPICGNYFKWVLEDQLGIKDFDHFEFTDEEMELLNFAAARGIDVAGASKKSELLLAVQTAVEPCTAGCEQPQEE